MGVISSCTKCTRLVNFLAQTKKKYPQYYCQPVPSFGDDKAQLLIIGLAPGLHGANATGRPFTGDDSGALLFAALHKHGYSTHNSALNYDNDMWLMNCKIINAVKCLPPNNKPNSKEINACNAYLIDELSMLRTLSPSKKTVILCLGQIAHKAVLKAKGLALKDYPFSHHARYDIDAKTTLIDSYHCGRYNTQTKRLTVDMFNAIFTTIKTII